MKTKTVINLIAVAILSVIFISADAQQKNAGIFEGYGDVGNPKLKGNFSFDAASNMYTISGGGINLWYASDQFFFAWKKMTGNFSMTAKVAFEGKGVDPHRKIGIMIRESLTGESRYADVAVHGDGLTSLQYRPVTGQQTLESVGPKGADWVTLERVGSKIRMRTATGTAPTEVTGEIELDFGKSCYVGIFIGSHNTDVLETAHFTAVEIKKL